MRIVIAHNTYQQPGGEDVAFEQERALLSQAGHEVIPYLKSNHEIEDSSLADRLTLVKKTIWGSDTRKEFADLIRCHRPDVVHVHNTFMRISPSIYSVCQEAGIPVVQTLHNYRLFCSAATLFRDGHVCEECLDHSLWRGVSHGCYRNSRAATATVALMLATHRTIGTWARDVDRYIALTEFARQKSAASGLPAGKIVVKPNFVAEDPGVRTQEGQSALLVGRLSPEKGLKTLLSAWERLQNQIPLQIVGDGPMRPDLEAQMNSHLPSVCFRGRLTREQTFEAMKNARFLVFPSEWYEGFPMTIAEAFACGVPVICSRLGSMAELVDDHRTGLHFTAGDAEDLAQKADWAWSHPREMAEMGRAARREYETRYTAQRNYSLLMGIYQQAIERHNRS
jgi:glycosyltransferase involved in cell wall biosynthesis